MEVDKIQGLLVAVWQKGKRINEKELERVRAEGFWLDKAEKKRVEHRSSRSNGE